MDRSESTEVLHRLLAGYPLVDLDDASLLAWMEAIEDTDAEPAKAIEVARRWPRTHERFPSLAEFLAIITPRTYIEPADPDDIRPDPETAHKLARVWRSALGQVAERRARIGDGRGADGHWHGSDTPCPMCGGRKSR